MSFLVFAGAVQQGLVYALTALSLLVSYRVLGLADLTVDGSFTLARPSPARWRWPGTPGWAWPPGWPPAPPPGWSPRFCRPAAAWRRFWPAS